MLGRVGRWLAGAIGNAGVVVGASKAVDHGGAGGGSGSPEQFVATAMMTDQARRAGEREDEPRR